MSLRVLAPAKLNLALEVLGRRLDGFHEIRSVVQAIALYDALEVEPADDLELVGENQPCPAEQNLALLAAERLRAIADSRPGARLRLTKRIPVGAGLGGGSSNAAAALRALVRHWRVDPAVDLAALAARLGSDVPLFLSPGAVLIGGRGEQVEPLPPLRDGWFVLVTPPWEAPRKTPRVYGAVRPDDYSGGETAERLAACLRSGHWPEPALLVNGLARAAGEVFEDLSELRRRLEDVTGAPFALSGAGPTLFSLARSRAEARERAGRVRAIRVPVRVARALVKKTPIRSL